MNTIIQELTEAIENGYGYLGAIERVQKEYELDYTTSFRLHELMLKHSYEGDSSYEDFTAKATIVLNGIGEVHSIHEVRMHGSVAVPYFQGKQVIYAHNSNLSDQDVSASLEHDYPGVVWKIDEHKEYGLWFWVPQHLVYGLDTHLRHITNAVYEFVSNEREVELTIEGYYDFIAKTDEYVCVMYNNCLADLIYGE